ncbi:MAG: BrnT family toxin [Desulfobacteraceae bacterium]|nr:BrnT family toxin [Desulfobacteraceae bacterium]
MKVELHNIQFEWDRDKADSNLKKHGILFETACEAFLDPFVKMGDEEYIEDEIRDTIIGMSINWQLLYIVFTMRDEDIIRITSARPVTKHERRYYEEA